MKHSNYKWGIYFNHWSLRTQDFGVGFVWDEEKYIHFNLFNLELAIGKTDK